MSFAIPLLTVRLSTSYINETVICFAPSQSSPCNKCITSLPHLPHILAEDLCAKAESCIFINLLAPAAVSNQVLRLPKCSYPNSSNALRSSMCSLIILKFHPLPRSYASRISFTLSLMIEINCVGRS